MYARDSRRRRKDHHLRLAQIADVIEVPLLDQDARCLPAPRSTLIRREVFTKTLKGALMVRKLLLWQTNKAATEPSAAAGFPAYVVYLTDFSPNRATPLERDIRTSGSLEQIEQLYQSLKSENIVKGWAPAAPA